PIRIDHFLYPRDNPVVDLLSADFHGPKFTKSFLPCPAKNEGHKKPRRGGVARSAGVVSLPDTLRRSDHPVCASLRSAHLLSSFALSGSRLPPPSSARRGMPHDYAMLNWRFSHERPRHH